MDEIDVKQRGAMSDGINLFGEPITDTPPRKPRDKAKSAWEAAFQRWSDKAFKCDKMEHYGKCGYGRICNYCDDSSKGRPCVRALNTMAREKHIKINYAERDFERWF